MYESVEHGHSLASLAHCMCVCVCLCVLYLITCERCWAFLTQVLLSVKSLGKLGR